MKEHKVVRKVEKPEGYVCQNIECQKPIVETADTIKIKKGRTVYCCPHCGYRTFLARDLSRSLLYEKVGGTIVRKGLKASEIRKAEKEQRRQKYWKQHERMVKG